MLILLTIIGIFIAFILLIQMTDNLITSIMLTVFLGVFIFIFSMVFCYHLDCWISETDFKENIIKQYEISSIKTSSSIKGDFFLGSGIIKSVPYYIFFAKKDNMFEQKTIPSNGVLINQSNKEQPNVLVKSLSFKTKASWWNWPIKELSKEKDKTTIITVPEGTIIQKYILE